MLGRGKPGVTRPQRGLPLKRQSDEPLFWAKLTALWHRERMREVYVTAGEQAHVARHRANREALDVAVRHGWRGALPQLKAELAELVVNELPGRGRADKRWGVRYWEEKAHVDLMKMLANDAASLELQLVTYLREEVRRNGPFSGRVGFYKLTLVVNYVPSMEHIDRRNAFLRALNEIGHDARCCDRDVYRVVLRLLKQVTHRPFETRLGTSMPSKNGTRRRKLFGFLPLGRD